MIWFLVNILGAFCWVCWAFGFIHYEPWVVPAAFCLLAVNCLMQAVKSVGGKT